MSQQRKAQHEEPTQEEEPVHKKLKDSFPGYPMHKHQTQSIDQHVTGSGEDPISPERYIEAYLKNLPIMQCVASEIPERATHPVVYRLNSNQTLQQALHLMTKHDVISCPVWDKDLGSYVGFVDLLDIMSLVVTTITAHLPKGRDDARTPLQHVIDNDGVSEVERSSLADLHKTQAFDISNSSHRDKFQCLFRSSTVYDAIKLLGSDHHRIALLHEDTQEMEAIIAQSTMVKFLYSNLDKLGVKARKPISSIVKLPLDDVRESDVVCISETALAFDAFRLMHERQVSAAGITNQAGKLVGVVSASDMKMLLQENTERLDIKGLFKPLEDFVSKAHEKNEYLLQDVVHMAPSDTLGIAMEQMVDNNVHRVFICTDGQPRGVCSMQEVLQEFLRLDEPAQTSTETSTSETTPSPAQ